MTLKTEYPDSSALLYHFQNESESNDANAQLVWNLEPQRNTLESRPRVQLASTLLIYNTIILTLNLPKSSVRCGGIRSSSESSTL